MTDEPIKHDFVRTGEASFPVEKLPPEALVVHCADPRFQAAFRHFVQQELGLKNYAPLAIGGAIHPFGALETMRRNHDTLWEQIQFFVNHAGINQVIVINHQDCAWYKANKALHPDIALEDKEKSDLATTAERLRTQFPAVRIRAFWAGMTGNDITFSELGD